MVGCVSVCAYFAVLFIPRKEEETRLPPARVASWGFFLSAYGTALRLPLIWSWFFWLGVPERMDAGWGIDAAWILADFGTAWMRSMVRRARVFPRPMPT
jgi:hypothetical protein